MNHQSKQLKFVLDQPKMISKEDLCDVEEKEQSQDSFYCPKCNNCSDLLQIQYYFTSKCKLMKKEGHSLHTKAKTYSSITFGPQNSSHSINYKKDSSLITKKRSSSQISIRSKDNYSLSESSEASCMQKKFYRCGCQNKETHSCGHKYQNYLAQLREQRIRKKQKMEEYFTAEPSSGEVIFIDTEKEFQDAGLSTPLKTSQLQNIAEMSESNQYSNKKFELSFSINFGGQKYIKKFESRDKAKEAIELLEEIVGKRIVI